MRKTFIMLMVAVATTMTFTSANAGAQDNPMAGGARQHRQRLSINWRHSLS